jgi:hypothetical protein
MHKFLVVACLLALPLASAQYNYDDYDFTEILTDANDHVGFYDVTRLAIAETGDGNLLLLVEQADNTMSNGVGEADERIIVRFITSGVQKALGYNEVFEPATQGAGDGNTVESCEAVSSTQVYCILSYGAASAYVGATLSDIQLWSYVGTIADQAPDGSFQLGSEATYTLVGCTLKAPENCPVEEVPQVPEDTQFFTDISETKFTLNQSMGAPFYGIYNYNFSVAKLPAFFNYTTEMTAGSVSFTISDSLDELAVVTVESNFTDSLNLDGFEGDWTMSARFDGFVGNVTYGMDSPRSAAMETNETMGEDVDQGNETMEPEEETESTPGIAFPILAVGLVVLARRRL